MTKSFLEKAIAEMNRLEEEIAALEYGAVEKRLEATDRYLHNAKGEDTAQARIRYEGLIEITKDIVNISTLINFK